MMVKFAWGGGRLNRFVRYHYVGTKEHRVAHSKRMVGNKCHLGCRHTEESKQKMSISKIGRKLTEETKQKMRGKKRTEEFKRNQRERMMGNKRLLGHVPTKETRQKNSESSKKLWVDPIYRDAILKFQKQLWADPVYHKEQRRRMSCGNSIRPNKPETQLIELLETIQPGDWKYVGDGSVVIDGKNPDFMHIDGERLIELFGDYWHQGENPEDRIAIFKPFGFKTLVIWESELGDVPKLIDKISEFAERGIR